MPRIGAGLGRGNWEEIVTVIEEELRELDVIIFEFNLKVP